MIWKRDTNGAVATRQDSGLPDLGSAGSEEKQPGAGQFVKWLFFLFVLLYVLVSHYHAPILTYLGRYLIVEHQPQRSDLIVCLAGKNIERGLATADAFKEGLSPRIFVAREVIPDGYEFLKERGIDYPETADLLLMILRNQGIPDSAIVMSNGPVINTFEEAHGVKVFVKENDLRSLILITSPTHSRRAWWIFQRVFEGEDVRLLMLPSRYSSFRPENWWHKGPLVRDVLLEYQKLILYLLRYPW